MLSLARVPLWLHSLALVFARRPLSASRRREAMRPDSFSPPPSPQRQTHRTAHRSAPVSDCKETRSSMCDSLRDAQRARSSAVGSGYREEETTPANSTVDGFSVASVERRPPSTPCSGVGLCGVCAAGRPRAGSAPDPGSDEPRIGRGSTGWTPRTGPKDPYPRAGHPQTLGPDAHPTWTPNRPSTSCGGSTTQSWPSAGAQLAAAYREPPP